MRGGVNNFDRNRRGSSGVRCEGKNPVVGAVGIVLASGAAKDESAGAVKSSVNKSIIKAVIAMFVMIGVAGVSGDMPNGFDENAIGDGNIARTKNGGVGGIGGV